MNFGSIYRCSEGGYYGDVDIWEQLESGTWTPHCWDTETGIEWMETEDGELLVLEPISRSALPEGVSVERAAAGTAVSQQTRE
ncbi:hypothetical protein SAMN04487948_10118 [Halogranum amylolyticum]|uniref:Uncharacterized protein n=1 Tax=Halogranum amylolyticum TaxID=660520 RepID=A0A1H8MQE5_9EURY|nr:hypothetical protein SAMN04487948_10118 [Halogranum amylolyticum]